MATELGMLIDVKQSGIKDAEQNLNSMANAAGRAEKATDGLSGASKKAGVASKGAGADYSATARDAARLAESIGAMNALADRNAKGMRASGIAAKDYMPTLNQLKEQAQANGASFTQLADASMRAGDGLVRLKADTGETLATLQVLSHSAKAAGMGAAEYELRLKELSKTAWKNGSTLKDLGTSYIEVTGSSYHLMSAQREVITTMARGKDQIKAAANEVRFFNGDLDLLFRAVKKVDDRVGPFGMGLRKLGDFADESRKKVALLAAENAKAAALESKSSGQGGTFTKYLAGFATLQTGRTIIQMADNMVNLNAQIKLATGSSIEYAAVQSELMDISNRTYTSFDGTVSLYTKTAQAAVGLGKSQQELLAFTESVNNAMSVGGVSAIAQSSAFLQLSQAMNAGAMKTQDFNAIMAQAPIILREMAKELGTDIAGLQKMAAEGKLTADKMLKLGDANERLGKTAAGMTVTMDQALTKLKNKMLGLTDDTANSSGAMATLASITSLVADNLNTIIPVLGGLAINFALASGAVTKLNLAMASSPIGVFAAAVGLLATQTGYAKEATVLFAGVMAGKYVSSMVGSLNTMIKTRMETKATTVAIEAATAATVKSTTANAIAATGAKATTIAINGLKTAFSFLGGPIGVITLAATALYSWSNHLDEAKRKTSTLADEINALAGAYQKLNVDQAKTRVAQLDVDIESLKDAVELASNLDRGFQNGAIRRQQWSETEAEYALRKKMAEDDLRAKKSALDLAIKERAQRQEQIRAGRDESEKPAKPKSEIELEIDRKREENLRAKLGDNAYLLQQYEKNGAAKEHLEMLREELAIGDKLAKQNKETKATAKDIAKYSSPYSGSYRISSGMSDARVDPKGSGVTKPHNGVDVAMPVGTIVKAMADGIVTAVKTTSGGYGKRVDIRHNDGSTARYAHLSNNNMVKEGQRVSAGQPVALSGNTGSSTGPHLHMEFRDPSGALKDFRSQIGKTAGKAFEGDMSNYQKETDLAAKQILSMQESFDMNKAITEQEKMLVQIEHGRYGDLEQYQKDALLLQAKRIDAYNEEKRQQEKIAEGDKLVKDTNKAIDDMWAELELTGLTAKAVEQLRFERDLEAKAKAIGAGMSEEGLAKLREEIELIKQRRGELEAEKAVLGGDWTGGIRDGLIDFVESAGTLREQFSSATSSTMNALGDAIGGMVTGARTSFRDLTASIMADLAKIAMRMAMMNLINGAVGMFAPAASASATGFVANGGNWGSAGAMQYGGLMGFAGGGYTGDGGKYEIAGPAHRGEYIFTKEETSRIGVRNLQNLAKSGYVNGGFVGGPARSGAAGSGVSITINNNAPVEVEAKETRDDSGNVNIEVMIKKVATQTMVSDFAGNGPGFRALQGATGLKRQGY